MTWRCLCCDLKIAIAKMTKAAPTKNMMSIITQNNEFIVVRNNKTHGREIDTSNSVCLKTDFMICKCLKIDLT